jgi:transposase
MLIGQDDEINTVSKKILLLAQEGEMARLLMTVPGIGYYSALRASSLEEHPTY